MTDPKSPAQELPALIEERRRYESWLAALDARRESTPQHVFDRVRSDYEGRLRQVAEQLDAHRHSIQEEKVSLESRRSLLEAEEQLRRDEKAELELRSHVGELAGGKADEAFRAVDEAIDKLMVEKQQLDARIGELEALLDNRPTPAAASETERAIDRAIEQLSPAEPAAPPTPEPVPVRPAMETPGGSFDELAFLSTVVNEEENSIVPTATAADADAPAESMLSDLSKPGLRRSGETPLAANVPGHTPIQLRSSGAIEQSKTLKCSECGAMNYPTEWYCERCGAELAAL
jgi:hypothetical protein